jgi:hypothetical protein
VKGIAEMSNEKEELNSTALEILLGKVRAAWLLLRGGVLTHSQQVKQLDGTVKLEYLPTPQGEAVRILEDVLLKDLSAPALAPGVDLEVKTFFRDLRHENMIHDASWHQKLAELGLTENSVIQKVAKFVMEREQRFEGLKKAASVVQFLNPQEDLTAESVRAMQQDFGAALKDAGYSSWG